MLRECIALIGCTFVASALAEEYDYEIHAGYERNSSDSLFSSTLVAATTRGKSDGDGFALDASWYFAGLSDDEGPRARAAFMSRASSVALGWSTNDVSSRVTTTGPVLPPTVLLAEASSDDFSARARYVWKQSGWYGLVGAARATTDIETRVNGVPTSNDFDASLYSLGVGKYVGKSTAVDFSVSWADADAEDSTSYAVTLTHIGDIGDSWQYGLDVSVAQSDRDDDDGTYGVRFSLFPTRDLEFGISIRQLDIGAVDGESYDAFASWFVSPNVNLAVNYGQQDPDTPAGQDVDSSVAAFDIRVRF